MIANAIPNPSREITIKEPIGKIRDSIHTVIKSFPVTYQLIDDDPILNIIAFKVSESDVVSKLSMDMGQRIDVTLTQLAESNTRIHLSISRIIGVIDKQFEINRATDTINTFLSLFSKSLQGKLNEVITNVNAAAEKRKIQNKNNALTVWIIVGILLLAVAYMIFEARSAH